MDRYVRVEQQKTEQASVNDNEVRIMAAGKMRNYISYATSLFLEKGHSSVVLKAMGRAINKSVTICEIIKRRIFGLHQNAEIGSIDITDTWEPLEEGLSRLETTRHVSVITIVLSKEPLDPNAPGYQAPLPEGFVKPLQEELAGADDEGVDSGGGMLPEILQQQQLPSLPAAAEVQPSGMPHRGGRGPGRGGPRGRGRGGARYPGGMNTSLGYVA